MSFIENDKIYFSNEDFKALKKIFNEVCKDLNDNAVNLIFEKETNQKLNRLISKTQ